MWGNFIDAGTVSNVDRPVSFNCNIVIDSDHWLAKDAFVVLQVQYHYYVTILYCYRIWLLSCTSWAIFDTVYMCLCLYFSIMIILFSFRAIL